MLPWKGSTCSLCQLVAYVTVYSWNTALSVTAPPASKTTQIQNIQKNTTVQVQQIKKSFTALLMHRKTRSIKRDKQNETHKNSLGLFFHFHQPTNLVEINPYFTELEENIS